MFDHSTQTTNNNRSLESYSLEATMIKDKHNLSNLVIIKMTSLECHLVWWIDVNVFEQLDLDLHSKLHPSSNGSVCHSILRDV